MAHGVKGYKTYAQQVAILADRGMDVGARDLAIATFGDNELLDFLQCPVLAVAQRHRDVAERVLEIVLASLDEPRKPKPGLTRIKRNLYRRGVLSRS